MRAHTDSCSWPAHCAFLESESCDCLIPHKSGYKDEVERNYADEKGLDAYKPCWYYLTWEQAIKIMTDACEIQG